jgi:altronate dehydratase small subunit
VDKVLKRALILSPRDTVANALEEASPGTTIEARLGGETVLVVADERIPFGFKVALVDHAAGDPVYKYGEVIGLASQPIRKGQLVHVRNVEGARGRGDLQKTE